MQRATWATHLRPSDDLVADAAGLAVDVTGVVVDVTEVAVDVTGVAVDVTGVPVDATGVDVGPGTGAAVAAGFPGPATRAAGVAALGVAGRARKRRTDGAIAAVGVPLRGRN
eukprot:5022877-Pyramimonas_sp.AAC.1